jgi:hypothetical protein
MNGYKKTKVNDNLNQYYHLLNNYQPRLFRKNYHLNDYHQELMQEDRLLTNNQHAIDTQETIKDALLSEYFWDTNV